MTVDGTSGQTLGDGDLAGLHLALIGPGRVGTSLAMWLRRAGVSVDWVVGRTLESSRDTADKLGAAAVEADVLMSKPWDLLLVAVPDQQLEAVTVDLARGTAAGNRRVALHTSGSHTAEALAPLRSLGVAVGSLHPLLGFAGIRARPEPAVVYGIDGDDDATELARRIAAALFGHAVAIPEYQRLLYHYCATLAAGGVTTVLAVVDELAGELGLASGIRGGLLKLSAAAVDAAARNADAGVVITGPIARGDDDLAAEQLQAAARLQPELKPFLERLHAETRRQVLRVRMPSAEGGEKGGPAQ